MYIYAPFVKGESTLNKQTNERVVSKFCFSPTIARCFFFLWKGANDLENKSAYVSSIFFNDLTNTGCDLYESKRSRIFSSKTSFSRKSSFQVQRQLLTKHIQSPGFLERKNFMIHFALVSALRILSFMDVNLFRPSYGPFSVPSCPKCHFWNNKNYTSQGHQNFTD